MSPDPHQLEAGIAGLEAQRALLGDAVVDASVMALRAQLASLRAAAAASPAEASQALKQVSILFLDVVGSTTLSQRLDPEAIGDVMDGALSRGTAIVAEHRGKVLQYAGDNLLAVFGAEQSREDDAERAVRCGLALLLLGKELGHEVHATHGHAGFDVRVGIHTGGVLLGGGVDEEGSIRGVSVNIAARMEQTAPPGALRISQDTYAQVRGVFDVAPQEPLAVKGVEGPVTSYLVERPKPRAFRVATRGIEGIETRMIGRDAELEVLQDAFKRLVRPGAGFERVTVVAEAGVGKSRLLYEFRNWAEARAERFFVFQARAVPQMQGQAYGLLRDLLAWRFEIGDGDAMAVAKQKLERGLMPLFVADEGETDAEAHAHLLGQLIGLDYHDSRHIRGIRDDSRQIRNRGFHAAAQALRRIASTGGSPLVVYLEDLHWADDPSLDFVEYLSQVDRDVPMLLIGMTRPTLFERRVNEAEARDRERRIELLPLDKGFSRLLADELLKKLPEIPAALRELVTGGADGNPFYMEELVKMLVAQGAIDTSRDPWVVDARQLLSLKVPPTLTGVLQARLDSLPPGERHALQLASVIGQDFWDAALVHLDREAAAALHPLAQRELVHARDAGERADAVREYTFRHQILHQVTYDTVLKRIKREAHAKTAQWLAEHSGTRARALLGTAAEHYERAGDAVRAADFYAQAAEQAAGIFANEAALDFTARALTLAAADAHALRWRLHGNRETLYDLLGKRSEQRADIDALLALADALDDHGHRADAAIRLATFAMRVSDYETLGAEGRRAAALARKAGLDEVELLAIRLQASSLANLGEPVAARALAEAALVRAEKLGSLIAQRNLCNVLGNCANLLGDLSASLSVHARHRTLTRRMGNPRSEVVSLVNLGVALNNVGAYDMARVHLEDALKLSRRIGFREAEGIGSAQLSRCAGRRGDDARALALAETAVTITIETGSRAGQADAFWFLGNAELALGRLTEAAVAYERSEMLAHELGFGDSSIQCLEGQLQVALTRDDLGRASALSTALLVAAGLDPSTSAGEVGDDEKDPFFGMVSPRLTLYRLWSRTGDPRADTVLAEAYRIVLRTARTITDDALKQSFLSNISEHREIVALSEARQPVGRSDA